MDRAVRKEPSWRCGQTRFQGVEQIPRRASLRRADFTVRADHKLRVRIEPLRASSGALERFHAIRAGPPIIFSRGSRVMMRDSGRDCLESRPVLFARIYPVFCNSFIELGSGANRARNPEQPRSLKKGFRRCAGWRTPCGPRARRLLCLLNTSLRYGEPQY